MMYPKTEFRQLGVFFAWFRGGSGAMCGVFGGERMETGGSMQHGVDMACKTVSGVKSGGQRLTKSRVAETGTGTAGCT